MTPEQASIYGWLQEKASHLAPIYRAAVLMVIDESFPGRVHFVAHAVREIRNRLPDAIAGEIVRGPTCYTLATKVTQEWDRLPPRADTGIDPAASSLEQYLMSATLHKTVSNLVEGNRRDSGNKRRESRRLLDGLLGDSVPPNVVSRWNHVTAWSDEYAHLRNKHLDSNIATKLVDWFTDFENVFLALVRRPYEILEPIDDILATANRR